MDQLKEFIEIKEKHGGEATFPTCIELEIFPHIEERIVKTLTATITWKLQQLTDRIEDKYVAKAVFETGIEDVKKAIEDNADA